MNAARSGRATQAAGELPLRFPEYQAGAKAAGRRSAPAWDRYCIARSITMTSEVSCARAKTTSRPAHSAQTAAALSTLQALFGDVGYTDHTHDGDGFAPRAFGSLSESMLETGISRL